MLILSFMFYSLNHVLFWLDVMFPPVSEYKSPGCTLEKLAVSGALKVNL